MSRDDRSEPGARRPGRRPRPGRGADEPYASSEAARRGWLSGSAFAARDGEGPAPAAARAADPPAEPPNPPKPTRASRAADEPPIEGGFWQRRKRRRARRKARVRAMSRPKRWLRRIMIAGTWLLAFVAALMVAAIVMYYEFTDVPSPAQVALPQVATIEYADGTTLAKIGTIDHTIVKLDQVPKQVQWAVLAAEDRSFYSDSAVSIRGTIRAALSDVTGGDTQGGSGITQQYVKNAYLSSEQTLTRKLKELMIAVKLSHEYSKDQILEYYLNTVYFGRGAYGIQAAAQAYFGKNVEKLDTAQGALLAALLRAPSYYDPAVNLSAAQGRWNYVMDGMVSTGHLTAAARAATPFPTTIAPSHTGVGASGWRYLLANAVLNELSEHGISERAVYAKGLTIKTTIDPKAQSAAVGAIDTTFRTLTKAQRNLKNALVAMNPANGAVLAYYGGSGPGVRDYAGKIDYNDYAGVGMRPPGSSFKPYVLATVLTQTLKQTKNRDHLAIDSLVPGDKCRTIAGTRICNDPGDGAVSSAQVTIANAMKYSLNTTFDLLALDAGPDNVAAIAHAMGIAPVGPNGAKTLVGSGGLTDFGIGIGDYPVTVLDQASGYATLADAGTSHAPYLVQSAVSSTGDVVYTHKGTSTRAIDPKVANDVTRTLEPVANYNDLGLAGGRTSASKTGTVGVSPKVTANSDAWMVGFTPQVSAAVWVGSGTNAAIVNAAGQPEYGRDLPGRTWQLFMNTYLKSAKSLPLATKQQIATNGKTPKPKPKPAPPTVQQQPSPTPTPTPSGPPRQSSTSAQPSKPPTTPPSHPIPPPILPPSLPPLCKVIGLPCPTS